MQILSRKKKQHSKLHVPQHVVVVQDDKNNRIRVPNKRINQTELNVRSHMYDIYHAKPERKPVGKFFLGLIAVACLMMFVVSMWIFLSPSTFINAINSLF